MTSLLDRQQQDRLDQQKRAHDDAEDTHRLGGDGEKDQGEEQVGQGDAGVAEGKEARAAGVEARRRHEFADQLEDPPDKRDEGEKDCDPSDDSDRPEVVRGYLYETGFAWSDRYSPANSSKDLRSLHPIFSGKFGKDHRTAGSSGLRYVVVLSTLLGSNLVCSLATRSLSCDSRTELLASSTLLLSPSSFLDEPQRLLMVPLPLLVQGRA